MTLFTLGYAAVFRDLIAHTGQKPQEDAIAVAILEIAKEHDAVVIDIRSNPHGLVSRSALERILRARYVFGGKELGYPQYRMNAEFVGLQKWPRAILLCAEANVNQCHRRETAHIIAANRNGDEIVHLLSPPDNGRPRVEDVSLDQFLR